jgi:hypothetical protein
MEILFPMRFPPPVTMIVLPSSEKEAGSWMRIFKRRLLGNEKRSIVSQAQTRYLLSRSATFSRSQFAHIYFWGQGFEQMQALVVTRGPNNSLPQKDIPLYAPPRAGLSGVLAIRKTTREDPIKTRTRNQSHALLNIFATVSSVLYIMAHPFTQ